MKKKNRKIVIYLFLGIAVVSFILLILAILGVI
jgi:hypothetical protein